MPSSSPVPAELRGGPFTTSAALRLISEDDLRGPSYRRLLRGVHTASDSVSHGDRILAARQVLPSDAVLGGLSALWALGVPLAGPSEPVEVILPPQQRPRSRRFLRVRGDRLQDVEVIDTAFGPVTTPPRTAFDVARRGDAVDTVPLLDALARETAVAAADVSEVVAMHPGARWSSRVAPALDLVDPGAESVRESQLRVALVQAGLPRPVTQYTIRNAAGYFVARVDLAWPELRALVEYDGAHHDERAQIVRDRGRMNALRLVGWSALVIDRAQFARRDVVVAMVRNMLVAAGARL